MTLPFPGSKPSLSPPGVGVPPCAPGGFLCPWAAKHLLLWQLESVGATNHQHSSPSQLCTTKADKDGSISSRQPNPPQNVSIPPQNYCASYFLSAILGQAVPPSALPTLSLGLALLPLLSHNVFHLQGVVPIPHTTEDTELFHTNTKPGTKIQRILKIKDTFCSQVALSCTSLLPSWNRRYPRQQFWR